jgi:hypothetical protein
MRRRTFIAALGGAAAWPLAVWAQQGSKLPTIGFLGQSTRSAASEWVAALVQRLRELGWIEGRNISDVEAVAHALGLEVVTLEIRRAQDIALAFETIKGRADALYVCPEGLASTNRIRITPRHWASDCRRCTGIGNTSKQEV